VKRCAVGVALCPSPDPNPNPNPKAVATEEALCYVDSFEPAWRREPASPHWIVVRERQVGPEP